MKDTFDLLLDARNKIIDYQMRKGEKLSDEIIFIDNLDVNISIKDLLERMQKQLTQIMEFEKDD